MRNPVKIVLAMAALSLPGAGGAADGTIGMNAVVPVVCRADLEISAQGQTSGTIGQVSELCNSPFGYRLVVNYNPATLQGANLSVGGDSVTLGPTGSAIVSIEAGAVVRQRPLSIENASGPVSQGDLLFAVVAS